jgi:hypothetical protein
MLARSRTLSIGCAKKFAARWAKVQQSPEPEKHEEKIRLKIF